MKKNNTDPDWVKLKSRRQRIMFYMSKKKPPLDTWDMARILGISRQSFSSILNERVDVKLSRLNKIAEILNIDVRYLI